MSDTLHITYPAFLHSMQEQEKFKSGQKIYGRMPSRKIFPISSSYPDQITSVPETIPFEGVVIKPLDNGKIKSFRLTKPINPENEATKRAREEGILIDVGDIITVDDSPEWKIFPLTD